MIDTALKPYVPGLPASEYLDGELWENIDLLDQMYGIRKRYNREYGFCLFTAEVVEALTKQLAGKKVIEAGSGSGWLSNALGERGIDITAADWTDFRTAERGRGYAIENVYRLDHHGDVLTLLPGDFNAVILVWPNLNSPFGFNVANAMQPGQVLVFEGEDQGGCTGDDDLYDLLDSGFVLLDVETAALNKDHRTFPGLDDKWSVWVKK